MIIIPICVAWSKSIEKHITLDHRMEGPDHKASLMPKQFKEMVESIRITEQCLGSGIKQASPEELLNKEVCRKSIVASRYIERGPIIKEEDITCKRPGTGISPMNWDRIVGTRATVNYEKDDIIDEKY